MMKDESSSPAFAELRQPQRQRRTCRAVLSRHSLATAESNPHQSGPARRSRFGGGGSHPYQAESNRITANHSDYFRNVCFDTGTIGQPRNSKTRFWADFPQLNRNRLPANEFRQKCAPGRSWLFGVIQAQKIRLNRTCSHLNRLNRTFWETFFYGEK